MTFLRRKKTKKEVTADVRRRRREAKTVSKSTGFLDSSKFIAIIIFLLVWGAVLLVGFVGLAPFGLQVVPNQVAKFRVVAEFPFGYKSPLKTKRLIEHQRQTMAPFYRIEMEPYQNFQAKIAVLQNALNTRLVPELELAPPDQWAAIVNQFNHSEVTEIGLALNPEDLLLIMERTTLQQRSRLFDEALLVLRDILRAGVFNPVETPFVPDSESAYRPVHLLEYKRGNRAQAEESAVPLLRTNLSGLGVDSQLSSAIYQIFRKGLSPNLHYDSERTDAEKQKVEDRVKPVMVEFMEGETIIEPGVLMTPDQIEAYTAYRSQMVEHQNYGWGIDPTLAKRSVLVLGLLVGALIYTQVALPSIRRSNRRLALGALVLIFNLALVRLVLELGESSMITNQVGLLPILPFAVPVCVSGLIMSIMLGAPAGVLVAVVISALNGLMQINSIDVFIVSLLANLVGIYFGSDIRLRTKVVKAASMSGLTLAVAAVFASSLSGFDLIIIIRQVIAASTVGVLTGILVIGVLPLLEYLFRLTTDITLLELTDFNHPLLRKLQIEAPGTYHHSLMVANLAERAANEIGANSLLCRATCLYHDIGKRVKPEYFAENQRGDFDPHREKNPSISALIIKNHVKEGVQMAKEAKLPQVFIDVIEQHHGTTLIHFFYQKAKEQAAQLNLPLLNTSPGLRENTTVDEAIFRYEGPRPQLKESAIIFFADAIEAASRSLKKITAQSVAELIDSIMSARLKDGQLDEAPLTVQEIAQIQDSFTFTLTNMLHRRVDYPRAKDQQKMKRNEP